MGVSQKNLFKTWRKNIRTANALFGCFHLILAQNQKLEQNFRRLGGRNVQTVGNLKIDSPVLDINEAEFQKINQACHKRTLLLAASTHPGEEDLIIRNASIISRRFS